MNHYTVRGRVRRMRRNAQRVVSQLITKFLKEVLQR